MLKKSAYMYETSGSQFFRTTIGIKSGPDTNLGDTGKLYSFRLVLEGKAGKEIPE